MSGQEHIICIPQNDSVKRFLLGKKGSAALLAIALNPSTANEEALDPTSRNIECLAKDNCCDSWYLVNLYPLRTPKPRELPAIEDADLSNQNLAFIQKLIQDPDYKISKVLLCWGNHVDRHPYLRALSLEITKIINESKKPSFYMELTGAGHPYHPSPMPVNRFLGGIKNVKLKAFKE